MSHPFQKVRKSAKKCENVRKSTTKYYKVRQATKCDKVLNVRLTCVETKINFPISYSYILKYLAN